MRMGRPPKGEKETRTCEVCGETWQSYPWDKQNTRFCSRDCWRVGDRSPRGAFEPRTKHCAYCGQPFLVGGRGNRRFRDKYCSKTCAMNGMWQGKGAHAEARAMTELECAWLAGLFDGEGCVRWPRRHILHSVSLDITNTCKPLIDHVSEITGTGRIQEIVRANPRHTDTFVWHAYGDNARSILRQLLPWLIVKKQAAEVALGIIEVDEAPWTQRTKTTRAAT